MQPFTLEGKTILITGASSGIGREVALSCAEVGATCILVARDTGRLMDVQSQCGGDRHRVESVDITDDKLLADLVERIPVVDGVVQCAGVTDNQIPLKFLSAELVDRIISVNLRAPMLLLAMLEKKKRLNRGASVVFLSSKASVQPSPAHSAYAASKGGITAFTRAAAVDLAGKKIRVNSIAPGMVNTPMIKFAALTAEQMAKDMARYPLKRYGEPSDIAGMAVYLLSDSSSWVTGQQFVIDGGVTIRGA